MGVLEKAALGNVKELRSFYLRDLVGPHATTYTDELDAQLVTDVAEPNWAGLFTVFDMDSRLRPDLDALVQAHKLMIGSSMETPDEARQDLNKPRMGGSAAKLWSAVNMAPIDVVSAPRPTKPAPIPPAETEPVEGAPSPNGKVPASA
jgi:hypothetical protein